MKQDKNQIPSSSKARNFSREKNKMENQQQQQDQQQAQQQQQHSYPQAPFHHLLQQQHQQLQMFWNYQRQEIEHANDFKNHQLPLARIKKIMKADEDVRMISAEAPILFAKACELFILELTIRSWLHAEENKRRTLQKNDIAAAITRTDIFDFLVDIVPRDEIKEEGASMGMLGPAPVPGAASSATAAAGVPYYYTQPPPPPGVMMGQPAMPGIDPSIYMQRSWPPVWQQGMSDDASQFGGATGMDGQGYVPPPPPSQ